MRPGDLLIRPRGHARTVSMTLDDLLTTTQRLNTSTDALAAIAALLRVRGEDVAVPEPVARRLEEVGRALGLELADLTPEECRIALGAVRAFFRQAAELVDTPDRPPGWLTDDPTLLQSQGRASMMVAPLLAQLAPDLGDLAERLASPGARLLDLGTGTGWLAIALARTFPDATVVGLDIAEGPLALARANVTAEGVDGRVTLRLADASAPIDEAAFDVVWVPGPFLDRDVVPAVVAGAHGGLRPGGWVVFGRYAGPDDPLAQTLVDLRVVRSGGHPWTAADVERLLVEAGFTDVQTPERWWAAPMVFTVGRRA